MKWIKKSGLGIVASLAVTSVLQAAPVIEPPVVLSEAMLSITASDLHGLIDGVGTVAAQVSPMMNGMMLKNIMGIQLGDPGFVGIAPSNGLAVVALDPTNIFAVVEVGAAQVTAYTNALAPKGVPFEYVDGLLVIGQTEEQVAKGVGLADAVKSTLLAKRSPTLRITLQPAAILERNNDQVQGLMAMMPMLLGQSVMQTPGSTLGSVESTLKILEGELRVLLSLAGQCTSAEVVLAPQDGSVRITKTFVPKAGSRLATLCNAQVLNQPNPKVNSGYLDGGVLRFDSTLANPAALLAFMEAEAEQLAQEMDLLEMDLPGLMAKGSKMGRVAGGSFSETVGFGGESGMSVGCLMDVTDEAEALAVLKAMPQDMAPLLNLYAEMDLPMAFSFKENVREYKGAKIHQLSIDMAMTNPSPDLAEQMVTLTNMLYDIAITHGVMIYAMGDTKVETLMDRLADESFNPASLRAHGVYPDGGFYYFDLDIGEYMTLIASFMPLPEMEQMAAFFQGVEPITSAGFKANDGVMWSINIPSELIAKVGQMAMMMQMQKIQKQGGGMPQDAPVQ